MLNRLNSGRIWLGTRPREWKTVKLSLIQQWWQDPGAQQVFRDQSGALRSQPRSELPRLQGWAHRQWLPRPDDTGRFVNGAVVSITDGLWSSLWPSDKLDRELPLNSTEEFRLETHSIDSRIYKLNCCIQVSVTNRAMHTFFFVSVVVLKTCSEPFQC